MESTGFKLTIHFICNHQFNFVISQTGVRNGVYPAHLQSLWLVIAIAIGLHFSQRHVPFDLVNKWLAVLPG